MRLLAMVIACATLRTTLADSCVCADAFWSGPTRMDRKCGEARACSNAMSTCTCVPAGGSTSAPTAAGATPTPAPTFPITCAGVCVCTSGVGSQTADTCKRDSDCKYGRTCKTKASSSSAFGTRPTAEDSGSSAGLIGGILGGFMGAFILAVVIWLYCKPSEATLRRRDLGLPKDATDEDCDKEEALNRRRRLGLAPTATDAQCVEAEHKRRRAKLRLPEDATDATCRFHEECNFHHLNGFTATPEQLATKKQAYAQKRRAAQQERDAARKKVIADRAQRQQDRRDKQHTDHVAKMKKIEDDGNNAQLDLVRKTYDGNEYTNRDGLLGGVNAGALGGTVQDTDLSIHGEGLGELSTYNCDAEETEAKAKWAGPASGGFTDPCMGENEALAWAARTPSMSLERLQTAYHLFHKRISDGGMGIDDKKQCLRLSMLSAGREPGGKYDIEMIIARVKFINSCCTRHGGNYRPYKEMCDMAMESPYCHIDVEKSQAMFSWATHNTAGTHVGPNLDREEAFQWCCSRRARHTNLEIIQMQYHEAFHLVRSGTEAQGGGKMTREEMWQYALKSSGEILL